MNLKFSKMHGTGNDYIYVNGFTQKLKNPSLTAVQLSKYHFSIGSDGLIIVAPSEVADVRMIMYNSDGSEGKMCGNGIRCVAKYAYDHQLTDKKIMTIETASGIKTIEVTVDDKNKVSDAKVNMGKAILKPQDIPMNVLGDSFISGKIVVAGKEYTATAVSMGNPHMVIFMKGIDELDLEKIGPYFENHEWFPEKVNTEFVEIIDDHNFKMRVYERGTGETMSCGTGTCAVTVAAVLNGYAKYGEELNIHIRGGILKDTYYEDGTVIMKGLATHVFDGEIEVNE
ncbi:MAG: diaminopimelate epimerase [Lachnospiraceae bacterium]|nr:diaminopimelate epimerase [Lachnospiraceae bacterium]